MKSVVERYLSASRSNLEVYLPSEQFEQWVFRVLQQCFPKLNLSLHPFRLRSADMITEFFETEGQNYVLFDLELSETLAELDYLAASSLPDLYSYVKIHLLFADSFRKNGNRNLARLFIAKAASQKDLLKNLRSATVRTAGFSISGTVVLLHELTHYALSSGDVYRNDWYTFCQNAITSFMRQLNAIVDTRNLDKLESLSGLSRQYIDQSGFFSQFTEMISAFNSNKVLHEEVTCDLFAAITFINLKAPVNFLETVEHKSIQLSLRELGDTFYKVVVTISNMQILSAIRQTAENITFNQQSETIGKELSEITLRHNILIYALTLVYKHLLKHLTFEENPGDPIQNLTAEQKEELFLRSVKQFIAKRDRLLLQPISNIISFLYEPDELTKAFQEEFGIEDGTFGDGFEWKDYDEIRKEVYKN